MLSYLPPTSAIRRCFAPPRGEKKRKARKISLDDINIFPALEVNVWEEEYRNTPRCRFKIFFEMEENKFHLNIIVIDMFTRCVFECEGLSWLLTQAHILNFRLS
jgi:hypothetical protein